MIGNCRICGNQSKLTKEHIPPKGAYNKGDFYISSVYSLLEKRDTTDFEDLIQFDITKATKKQGGIGFYTLCKNCNNDTGSWYGNDYIKWIQQTIDFLRATYSEPLHTNLVTIYPLRVLKQIVAMFFSLNHISFRTKFPSLCNFILHKENTVLDSKIRVFAYYPQKGGVRYIADNFIGDFATGKIFEVSEITFPPIGFVMCMNGEKPDKNLIEITWFSSYKYDETINYEQKFNLLPTFLQQVPCDYRSESEIRQALEEAKKYIDKGI